MTAGSVASLWRYPVKSMMGEQLSRGSVTVAGVAGDRVFAVVDHQTGKVASAKNPKKWAGLMACRAELIEGLDAEDLEVVMTLPDGRRVRSDQADAERVLSDYIGREVRLARIAPETPILEEYSPDLRELPERDVISDEAMPAGTFFDVAVIHLLTTATLERLQALYPAGRVDVRRFRPNIVIEPGAGEEGFVDTGWIGRSVASGNGVRLEVTRPCPRCVMTTLPQGDLPRDTGILRTTARYNDVNAGVYASVISPGVITRGDAVTVR